MKLRIVISIMAALSAHLSYGQGWINNGASLVFTDSVHVVITSPSGHFLNKNNGLVYSRRESFVHLRGNWINNANNPAIATNNGTVLLDGGYQEIQGNRPTSFYNLDLSGTGNKILMVNALVGGGHNGTRNGVLRLNDKLLFLNSQTLVVNNQDPLAIERSSGYLIGETPPAAGYSKVQWTIRNSASGTKFSIPFASTDLIPVFFGFEVTTAGSSISDSGHIKVAMYPTDPLLTPNNRPLPGGVGNLMNAYGLENDIKSVDRFYIVESGYFGFQPQMKLHFPYIDREWDAKSGSTNSIDEGLLRALRYQTASGLWQHPGAGTANTTANVVESDAGTSFSGNWVLHHPPYCPKAAFEVSAVCEGVPAIALNRSTIIQGNIDSTLWRFNGLTDNNPDSISHVFPSEGTYTIQLLVRSDRGCWDSLSRVVTIHPNPVVRFSVRDTCLGEPTQLVSQSTTGTGNPLTNQWFIPGLPLQNGSFVRYVFPDTGKFEVKLLSTNQWGCRDSFSRSFFVRELPVVDFYADAICEGGLAEFIDQTGSGTALKNWTWHAENEVFSYNQNAQRRFNVAGSYPIKLIVENGYGCRDSITKPLLVKAKASAAFSFWPDQVRISEPLVRFIQESQNANDFLWDFGDGQGVSNLSDPTYEYKDTGKYAVLLVANNNGDCPDTTMRIIYVGPDIRIYIPNAFTPHGPDDLNATFKPVGILHGLHEFYMEIYNRWGELLYVTDDLDKPWDGTYRGEPVEQENYLYLIKVVDVFRNEHWYKGIVTLLR